MSENGSNASDRSGTKRKLEGHHMFGRESDDDDDNISIGSSKYSRMSSDSGGSSSKKQNHSEIEKRRRDKMNCYISELSQLIPMCQSRKLDKLTVLRMTVQHMKMLRNSAPSAIEGQFKPAFVTDQDMKNLILQAADGFVFVVGCDRGRVLYVSKSVENVLDYTQDELIGQSLFDILHPRDVSKVKEQLASSDLTARSQLIDSKTLLPIPTSVSSEANSLCPGSMRSFFCRMKCGQGGGGGGLDEPDTVAGQRRQRRFSAAGDKRFKIVHCAGYLKAWVPSSGDVEKESDEEGCNLSCLVAIGRLYSKMAASPCDIGNRRPQEFFSRHTTDGKFLYADQRVTLALGYLPHELVGTSIYELCHPDDIARIAETHRHCLQSPADETQVYKFRVKSNSFVTVRTRWKAFKNPWTKELEYISASNEIMNQSASRPCGSRGPRDPAQDLLRGFSPLKLDGGTTEAGGSASGASAHKFDSISASKIGRRIADEVLDSSRRPSPSLASASPSSNVETLLENIRDNSNSGSTLFDTDDELLSSQQLLTEVMQDRDPASEEGGGASPAGRPPPPPPPPPAPPLPPPALHGRNGLPAAAEAAHSPAAADAQEDEAAMAVIMSLLEADAGLGGPVDFTGLPWPLP